MQTEAVWSFLIVAGGSGSRLGGEPKQFRMLGGIPVWQWSVRTAALLWRGGRVKELVIVVPSDYIDCVARAHDSGMPISVVEGGKTRTESVLNGLKNCSGSHVLVHDGARPFITENLCLALMETAEYDGSAVPAFGLCDSIRKSSKEGTTSANRADYIAVQTPQAFERHKLISVIEERKSEATDEATLWEQAGYSVSLVPGDRRNFKITDQFDWEAANALIETRKEIRTGHGYDVHQLVRGRKLILAGLEIENDGVGLLGHSDADIVTHTVMDAILGAAGEPDIGTLYPASDEKWKDAVSTELLKDVVMRVREKGWKIDWVDVTLEAQAPRLGHRISDFIENLLPIIQEADGTVNFNMKAKSGENCGSVGRGECMICHGVATLSRYKQEN